MNKSSQSLSLSSKKDFTKTTEANQIAKLNSYPKKAESPRILKKPRKKNPKFTIIFFITSFPIIILLFIFNIFFFSVELFYFNIFFELVILLAIIVFIINLRNNQSHIILTLILISCVGFGTGILFFFSLTIAFSLDKKDYKLIVHSGGGKDGHTRLSAIEVFEEYYNKGFKVIELDVLFTKDEEIFCAHDFGYIKGYSIKNRPSINEIKNDILILGKYHPIYIDWVLNFLKIHQDLTIIIDPKEKEKKFINLIQKLIIKCEDLKIDYKVRIIPIIYSKRLYKYLHYFGFEEMWYNNLKKFHLVKSVDHFFKDKTDIKVLDLSVFEFMKYKILFYKPTKQKIEVFDIDGRKNVEFFAQRGVDYILTNFPYQK